MKDKENAPLDSAKSSGATDNQIPKYNNFIAAMQSEIQALEKSFGGNGITTIKHTEILTTLLEQIQRIDFREEVGLTDESQKLSKKHYLVSCIENILEIAHENNWGICRNHDFIYLYNGAYWSVFDNAEFESFLGQSAERMGIDKYDARLYSFRQQLIKQFLSVANLPKPTQSDDVVLVNLGNR
jgi:putative DNA primase/helicase